MSNICGRCRSPMSSHDDHASCLEAGIISKPAPSTTSSGPASEISSLVSGDDLSDRLLVSTSSPLAQQDLVVPWWYKIWRPVRPLQHLPGR